MRKVKPVVATELSPGPRSAHRLWCPGRDSQKPGPVPRGFSLTPACCLHILSPSGPQRRDSGSPHRTGAMRGSPAPLQPSQHEL